MRERENLIRERCRFIQRMHKAMTKMNLMLHNVLSDIMGMSGQKIIQAILGGERDAKQLSALRDHRCKETEETIVASLTGYYQDDQLYLLKMNYESWLFFGKLIDDLDYQIASLLKQFPIKTAPEAVCPEGKKRRNEKLKNTVKTRDNLEDMLYRINGVNLAEISGIRGHTILQIGSEVGFDMSKFPTAKQFASYLGFVPRNKITGGRIISCRTDRIKSSAVQAFKKVIPAISRTDTQLGAFYRKLQLRIGTGGAVTATCRKLAILYYNSLKYGEQFVEYGEKQYLEKLKIQETKKLIRLAEKYNILLIPIQQEA